MLNLSTLFMFLLALVLAAPTAIATEAPSSLTPPSPPSADAGNQQDKHKDDAQDDDEEADSSAEQPKPVDAHTASMLGLAQKSGCLACHKIERKLVGPGWSDVAQRYRNDPHAHSKLFEKVSRGGGGNWTEVTDGRQMPPYGERVAPGRHCDTR